MFDRTKHSLAIQASARALLAVGQNIREAFRVVQRVYVLKLGRIVFEDQPDVLVRDARLRKAYLG